MTDADRELMVLAAKAAGLELDWDYPCPWTITGEGEDRGPGPPWLPLADDGDALRLVHALRLSINHTLGRPCVGVYGDYDASAIERYENHPDIGAATRRAIVRCAAEIGRLT